jgi:hypothetical protein
VRDKGGYKRENGNVCERECVCVCKSAHVRERERNVDV